MVCMVLIRIATLGYKQELRRHYSTVEIFAVAFSIMGLLPSIASTLAFSMPAGPVGMVWVCFYIFFCSMSLFRSALTLETA